MLKKEKNMEKKSWAEKIVLFVGWFLLAVSAFIVVSTFGLRYAGIEPRNVVSNSMVPAFKQHDLVFVSTEPNNIAKDDVVAYQANWSDGKIVTHRVVDVDNGVVTTKGDNNSNPDPAFDQRAVLGEVVGVAPNAGWFFNKVTLVVSVLLGAAIIAFAGLLFRRGSKDDEVLSEDSENIDKDVEISENVDELSEVSENDEFDEDVETLENLPEFDEVDELPEVSENVDELPEVDEDVVNVSEVFENAENLPEVSEFDEDVESLPEVDEGYESVPEVDEVVEFSENVDDGEYDIAEDYQGSPSDDLLNVNDDVDDLPENVESFENVDDFDETVDEYGFEVSPEWESDDNDMFKPPADDTVSDEISAVDGVSDAVGENSVVEESFAAVNDSESADDVEIEEAPAVVEEQPVEKAPRRRFTSIKKG